MKSPITVTIRGFNHHAFELTVEGDRPPTVKELVSVAKAKHPNWKFTTSQDHINSTFESWHRHGRCQYSLGTRFLRKLVITEPPAKTINDLINEAAAAVEPLQQKVRDIQGALFEPLRDHLAPMTEEDANVFIDSLPKCLTSFTTFRLRCYLKERIGQ